MTKADRVVQTIVRDLRSRKGLRNVWDDEIDSGIKREIMREWRKIIDAAIVRTDHETALENETRK